MHKLNAKQTLLPCGDVMNWDSPDSEDVNQAVSQDFESGCAKF